MLSAVAMGGADCEMIGNGWLAQPVASGTSLAYLVAGAWLCRSGVGRAAPPAMAIVSGVALAGVGVGSFAYHGPQPGWAGFVHDQSIVAFLALLVGHLAWGLRRRGVPTAAAYVAVTAATVVLLVPAGQSRAVPIVLGAALLVGTLVCAAIADGGAAARASARAWATPAAVFIAAAIAYLVGRTASAFCRPEAWAQPHGAWHVLSAVGLALVANRVVVGRAPPA